MLIAAWCMHVMEKTFCQVCMHLVKFGIKLFLCCNITATMPYLTISWYIEHIMYCTHFWVNVWRHRWILLYSHYTCVYQFPIVESNIYMSILKAVAWNSILICESFYLWCIRKSRKNWMYKIMIEHQAFWLLEYICLHCLEPI